MKGLPLKLEDRPPTQQTPQSKFCQARNIIHPVGGVPGHGAEVQCDRMRDHAGPHQTYQFPLFGFATIIWAGSKSEVAERAVLDG